MIRSMSLQTLMIKSFGRYVLQCHRMIAVKTINYAFNMPKKDPGLPSKMMPFNIQFLHDNAGARRYPKQVGRGPGSGKGKFAGRGMKGMKARAGGGVPPRFEGGQTPITKRLPKYGRVKRKMPKEIYAYVNLYQIDHFVKKGILKPDSPITVKLLHDCGLVKKVKFGVKLLAKGAQAVNYPLHVEVNDASKPAIKQIEAAGGSVKLIFRTPLKTRQHIFPEKFPLALRDPLPPAWRVRKLARKQSDRGLKIAYRKPMWKIEEQKEASQTDEDPNKFIYPVPRVPCPDKVRTRKPKLYRKISYNL